MEVPRPDCPREAPWVCELSEWDTQCCKRGQHCCKPPGQKFGVCCPDGWLCRGKRKCYPA